MLPESREGYLERYAALNFALIPLEGKKPIWNDWTRQFVTASADMRQVFMKEYPKSNIGLVLEPSGLVSLDVDAKTNGNETLQHLEYEHGFQDTLRSVTGGGGQRLFYRAPPKPIKTAHKFAPGIELLAIGAQAVVPPSIHPDTHAAYLWDMMDDELDREHIRELPQWILDRLLAAEARPAGEPVPAPAGKITQGTRHKAMVSMAGVMRHRMAATESEILGYLRVFNQRCEPLYDDAHLVQIAKSMMRYQPEDPNIVSGMARAYGLLRQEREEIKKFQGGFNAYSGSNILQGDYQPLAPVIEDMVYEGLTILYGPPKIGKSYLTTQMALAVANGAPLFGQQETRAGVVLYMSIEEPQSQTYTKLKQLTQDPKEADNIQYCYTMPKLLEGGLDYLERGIEQVKPSLCVIDSFRAISSQMFSKDIVEREYLHTTRLSGLGKRTNTAIVLIHHGAKRNQGETLMDGAAGTHGITAGADCVARLSRAGEYYTLQGEGREIQEYMFALGRDIKNGIGWFMNAKGEDAHWTAEREDIFMLLKTEAPKNGMTPKAIAAALGKNGGAIRRLLRKMADASQVVQNPEGKYVALGDKIYCISDYQK